MEGGKMKQRISYASCDFGYDTIDAANSSVCFIEFLLRVKCLHGE